MPLSLKVTVHRSGATQRWRAPLRTLCLPVLLIQEPQSILPIRANKHSRMSRTLRELQHAAAHAAEHVAI